MQEATITKKRVSPEHIRQRIQSFVMLNRIPTTDLKNLGFIDPAVVTLIPEDIAQYFHAFAFAQKNNLLSVAMANPFDPIALDVIQKRTGFKIDVSYANTESIDAEIDKYYSQKVNLEESMKELVDFEIDSEDDESDEEQLRIQAEDAPAIKFVNLLLLQATQDRASDVHIEPQEKEVKVRLRVDGILREISPPPKRMQSGIISRIKILGGLDIAERRIPQDGRTKIKILGRQIDIRISSLPTIYGEKIVMRILDKGNISLNIDDIGFENDLMTKFKNVLSLAHGMVLVTGPTGSGKTTTLYSALNYVNSPQKNIITVEDPVEYRLKGINQIQARPQVGLTFAAGLRSILRQDPDIVMVGEIRDRETAEIAIKASLTGHLVLSTLHTNDAVSTVIRLINMGIDKYLICSALSLIIAQRLTRRICLHCKTKYTPDEETMLRLRTLQIDTAGFDFYKGNGCDHCGSTGFWGRMAIYEFFFINSEIKEMIINDASEESIRKRGTELGMASLLQHGIKKVKDGRTTIDEVLRIV